MRILSVVAVWLCLVSVAAAVPIVYESELVNGVPVAGINTQGTSNQTNPIGANYFSFFSDGVTPITVFGDRQSGHYDMSFMVFNGIHADTSTLGAFIDFADDEDPPNIPGPFGDPRAILGVLPAGGYTVAVTNFLSSAGPPNPFTLQANGVVPSPEPTSILGFAMIAGVGLLGYRLRRRKVSA